MCLSAIGLAIGAGGALLSSKSNNKAANKAADTSLQVAGQNNALAANIYGQNQQALSPFMARGNAAGDTMNALLGLGGGSQPAQAPQAAYGAPAPPSGPQSFYSGPNPAASPAAARRNAMLDNYPLQDFAESAPAPQQTGIAGPLPQSQQQAANSAFDIFRNSTGYQFRLGEGANALNSQYAGRGTLQSGAAAKALQEYGQNFASNEFGNYMGYLGNQQGVGLSGASALAGVGQNYANSVMANNNNAGNSVANAALAKGANNPWANTLGLVGGGLWGMSQ
jgi:hypothetical protein